MNKRNEKIGVPDANGIKRISEWKKRISEWKVFTIQGDQSLSIYELSCYEPKPRSTDIVIGDH
jgi:hypothetical protein